MHPTMQCPAYFQTTKLHSDICKTKYSSHKYSFMSTIGMIQHREQDTTLLEYERITFLPKWLLSALWYIASCNAFVCTLLNTGSLPSLRAPLPSAVCCWTLAPALPSASISSKDNISFSPRLAEKLSGCDSSWWRQLLWPCAVATEIALEIKTNE